MLQNNPAMMQQFMQSQGLNANDPHTAKLFNDVSQFLITGQLPAAVQNGGSTVAGAGGVQNPARGVGVTSPAAIALTTVNPSALVMQNAPQVANPDGTLNRNATYYGAMANQAAQIANAPDPRAAFIQVAQQNAQASGVRPNLLGFNPANYDPETFRALMTQASQSFAEQAQAPQSSSSSSGGNYPAYRATMPTYGN